MRAETKQPLAKRILSVCMAVVLAVGMTPLMPRDEAYSADRWTRPGNQEQSTTYSTSAQTIELAQTVSMSSALFSFQGFEIFSGNDNGYFSVSTSGGTPPSSYKLIIAAGTPAGSYSVGVRTFIRSGGVKKDATVTLNINKATPSLSSVSATSITKGSTLSSSTISGTAKHPTTGSSVPGTWSWASPSTTPSSSGTYTAQFTPSDTTSYNSVSTSVYVTVIDKDTPTVTAPTAKTLTYTGSAQALVNAGSTTGGTLQYAVTTTNSAPSSGWSTSIPTQTNAGSYYVWYRVVGNSSYYDVAARSVSVSINKATNPITFANETKDIPYGSAQQTAFNGAQNAQGEVSYSLISQTGGEYFSLANGSITPAADTPVGSYDLVIRATAAGNANYNSKSVDATVTANITKAQVIISSVSATPVTYGAALSASTITGTVQTTYGTIVDGTFSFDSPDTTPSAGTASHNITFTPSDTSHYEEVKSNVAVTVNPTTPLLSNIIISTLFYGQSFSEATITGIAKDPRTAATLDGSWSFENPSEMPEVGSASATVIFTPNDTNYASVSGLVTVTVDKSTPSLSDLSASDISYGQILDESSVSATAKNPYTGDILEGTFSFEETTTRPDVGAGSYTVVFTPNDPTHYNPQTASCAITTTKVQPLLSDIVASDIAYGDNLSQSIITGLAQNPSTLANVDGVWSFDNPAVIFDLGQAEHAIHFTPTDATRYEPVSATVLVTVNKIDITPSVSLEGWIYGDSPHEPVVTDNPEDSEANYTYYTDEELTHKTSSQDGASVEGGLPAKAGSYYVRADIEETDHYKTGFASSSFEIAPREVTVSGIEAFDKVYDGTTDITLSYENVTFDNKLQGDILSVTANGVLSDKNAGANKQVNLSDITLTGEAHTNYVLAESGQQTETSAAISPLAVSIVWSGTSLIYNGQPQGPSVAVGNKVSDDEVYLTVEGQEINAGVYSARVTEITGPDKDNYLLTGDLTRAYAIGKADVTLDVYMQDWVYGDKASEPVITGVDEGTQA